MFRVTGVIGAAGVCLVLLLSGLGAAGQDTTETPKLRGQLPQGWKKIGLSEDQVQKVYKVRGQYRSKISKLEAQLKELRTEERSELFRILTADQKTKLRQLNEEKTGTPPAKETRIETKKQ